MGSQKGHLRTKEKLPSIEDCETGKSRNVSLNIPLVRHLSLFSEARWRVFLGKKAHKSVSKGTLPKDPSKLFSSSMRTSQSFGEIVGV